MCIYTLPTRRSVDINTHTDACTWTLTHTHTPIHTNIRPIKHTSKLVLVATKWRHFCLFCTHSTTKTSRTCFLRVVFTQKKKEEKTGKILETAAAKHKCDSVVRCGVCVCVCVCWCLVAVEFRVNHSFHTLRFSYSFVNTQTHTHARIQRATNSCSSDAQNETA